MAFSAKAGTFALNLITGNQSITGLGFQPVAIIFNYSRQIIDGSVGNISHGKGFAVSSSKRCAVFLTSLNASLTSDTDRRHTEGACITTIDNTGTLKEEADLVSMDADGFTINVTTAGLGIIVGYIALGGTSLTNANIIRFSSKTTTGSQGYTGVGFQPDSLMLMGNIDSGAPPVTGAAAFIHQGMGVGTTGIEIFSCMQNNATNSDRSGQRTDRIIDFTTTGSAFIQASLTSLDADGFTLNWGTANGTGRTIYALCLKGGSFAVGSFNQKTSTGNQAITGVGFRPAALLLASNVQTANTGYQNNSTNVFGLASSSANRMALGFGSILNSTPANTSNDLDRTKVLKMITPNNATPTVQAEADLVSLDADGFTLNWDIADATARQILYMAFGPGTAPPAGGFKMFGDEGMVS